MNADIYHCSSRPDVGATMPERPAATTTMSASRVWAARSVEGMRDGDGGVGGLQHQCHRLPDKNAVRSPQPVCRKDRNVVAQSITPAGVQLRGPGSPFNKRPRLSV